MKKFDIKKVILAIAIGFLLSGIVVSAAEVLYSKNFTYSTSNSTLKSTNVQGAIDELATKSKSYCPSKYKCYKLKSTPEAGDYVKMTPTLTSYTTDTSKTGYDSTQTINPSKLNLWRVLKVNSDGTIEMISEYTSSTSVYFRGKVGYQNLVGYLNTLASKYENSKYTKGSRYVGYNGQTEYISSSLDSIVDSLIDSITDNLSDTLYEKDCELVKSSIGTLATFKAGTTEKNTYWLASRYYDYYSSNSWDFYGRRIDTDGSLSYFNNLYYCYNGKVVTASSSHALRPIVILKSGITYAPATGTSEDPFVLN